MNDLVHIIHRSYRGRYLYGHIVAVFATLGIVFAGIDWQYFLLMQEHASVSIVIAADTIGWIVPFVLPMGLIMYGRQRERPSIESAGWAIARAEIAAVLIVLAYKSVTGRVSPPMWGALVDTSRDFNFGFLRESVYGGWPSSHTAVAFATAASVVGIFSNRPILWIIMFSYALFIGLGEAIGFHWFSEAIAGSIIGTIVGFIGAESYRNRVYSV